MINKLKNGFDKNIVCVKSFCRKDGHLLESYDWDRFFEYRVIDIENFAEEVAGYLERCSNYDDSYKYVLNLKYVLKEGD